MIMLIKNMFKKKPDTIVEIFLQSRFWHAKDQNGEILCHSETYSRTDHAVRGGKAFAARLKRPEVRIVG